MADNQEFPPKYDPKATEAGLYEFWEKEGLFSPDPKSDKPPYVIVIPPPNVTGVLHMGHALTNTLEDILIRRKRMQGFNTLWLPGTDHAGIATQMVVERRLIKEEKKNRHDLGREPFLKKVWEWKEQSQGTILGQLRRMGCSLDWTRLRFTLDEGLTRAVRESFVRLYDDGLIYRDTAMINWCPRCHTALSDLEVKGKEVTAKIWSIRYPLKDDPSQGIIVATTRPETLLGDTAVAVHPEDDRYDSFRGKQVVVPLVDRPVSIIEDEYVDREFGTGALKITPAHDPNDYEIGKKHKLELIDVLDESARLNERAGEYQGLSREEGRKRVLAQLEKLGLLVKEDSLTHNVGHCDRCGVVVEPRVSQQWFVEAEVLAKPAIAAVKEGKIKIIPEEWEKNYFEWMNNIRPWCISRQLWWGHRIPVWYCQSCKKMTVKADDPSKCDHCASGDIVQDEDVLDTWFSSGLWPFSTMGWPEKTEDLKNFYPTDVLETGFDILFFWVARMIMMGLRMTGEVPFHTVYLHPMVRDEYGQKMSKTKGNVKDPLDIIHTMGADALRFTLTAMAVHGRDVLLSDSRIQGYRNFVNKIWNASRFVMMHFAEVKTSKIDLDNDINRWIWTRLNRTKAQVNDALDQYRFYEAANLLYHFLWSEYCDWFIELIKSPEELERRKAEGESTAVEVLDEVLRLLHPVMPFVTETLWQRLPVKSAEKSISVASYPKLDKSRIDPDAEKRIGRMIAVVDALRSKRGENNLSPEAQIDVSLYAENAVIDELNPFKAMMEKLIKAKSLHQSTGPKPELKGQVYIHTEDVEIFVPRDQLVDTQSEIERTQKELVGLEGELERAKKKLANPGFANKAPANVVDGVRERQQFLENKVTALQKYLQELQN